MLFCPAPDVQDSCVKPVTLRCPPPGSPSVYYEERLTPVCIMETLLCGFTPVHGYTEERHVKSDRKSCRRAGKTTHFLQNKSTLQVARRVPVIIVLLCVLPVSWKKKKRSRITCGYLIKPVCRSRSFQLICVYSVSQLFSNYFNIKNEGHISDKMSAHTIFFSRSLHSCHRCCSFLYFCLFHVNV